MDRFPHKFLIRFLLVLVSVMLLLVVFEWIEINFKAKNFPCNQQNTVWSSPDRFFTIAVSDEVTTLRMIVLIDTHTRHILCGAENGTQCLLDLIVLDTYR